MEEKKSDKKKKKKDKDSDAENEDDAKTTSSEQVSPKHEKRKFVESTATVDNTYVYY